MRKFIFAIFSVFTLIGSSWVFAEGAQPSAKVIAYYFHGSFRCPTCMNMEKYSREAIDSNFKDALASGKLEFNAVNVEDHGNEHFVDGYKLHTKALILSLVKGGKEIKHRNLDKIWELAHNKQKFINYVTGEVTEFMKDAR